MEKQQKENPILAFLAYTYWCIGLITCVVHEATHYVVAFLFAPFSSHMRGLIKSTHIIMRPGAFAWGMALEKEPVYVNDYILRVFVGVAPLGSLAVFIWAFFALPAVGALAIACKVLVCLGVTNLWPSKPDWHTSITSLKRIWNVYFAENQAYNILAKKLEQDKGLNVTVDKKKKYKKGKNGITQFKLPKT